MSNLLNNLFSPQPSQYTLHINGFDLFYQILGSGQPLLLLHGFTGSSQPLLDLLHDLSHHFQLIAPDLRGHGKSTNPSQLFSFKQTANDILALLNHLNISQCAAIGFSGGGCALLHLAYQYPSLIPSMALVSAAPYFPDQTRSLMRQSSLAYQSQESLDALRKIHHHGDPQIQLLLQQANAMADDYDDMNFTPPMLSTIQSKTLLIQGDNDPLYPLEITTQMYHSIPNSHLWILPNSGHVPITDSTAPSFKLLIQKFLSL